jgi:hypothetical protein
MKKLSKLSINPSKVMKNEELVNLKGGYGGYDGGYDGEICVCSGDYGIIGNILFPSKCSTSGCTTECKAVYDKKYPGQMIIGLCKP